MEGEEEGFWRLEVIKNGKKQETLWFSSGKIRATGLQIDKWQLTKIFYENGNLEEFSQRFFGKIWTQATNQTHEGLLTVGKTFSYYPNGKLKNISCSDLDIYEHEVDENNNCGIEYKFDESGKLIETIDHKRKCKMGCGRFRPFLGPGKYISATNSLRIREKPNKSAKIIGTLKKGEEVEITKDMGNVETIDDERAPWVEIRFQNGLKG
ncbi:MAG: SH3 domain-containing protein [Leptospiraceae bacterium]|nr:SH3 domain-containing protein [Leptospiraceae bacterium]NUM42689.1 SH3 domain-containing protein [Leptospiraceae bacterium]